MSRYYRRYRANGTVRTVTIILIAVLALGLVFSMADGFSFGGLSLIYNGSKVDDGTSLLLPQDVQLRFDVKKGLAAVPRSDYNISIIPYGNVQNAFKYSVDGDSYSFDMHIQGDLSHCFNVFAGNGYFTITPSSVMTMQQYLQQLYPYADISIDAASLMSIDMSEKAYFAIEVTSKDGADSLLIPFKLQNDASQTGKVNISGTWYFNESINLADLGTYMVRFTVPGAPDAKPLSLTVSSSALVVNMISGDPVTVFDKTGYVNADYQEISFGDTPQAVPQSFYIWLINNATLQ